LVADIVSGFKTLEQSSGNQRPKFWQEVSKFGARPGTQGGDVVGHRNSVSTRSGPH